MKEQGYIDQTQYDDAIADPVYERIQATNAQYEDNSSVSSYFIDAVADQVIEDLVNEMGYTRHKLTTPYTVADLALSPHKIRKCSKFVRKNSAMTAITHPILMGNQLCNHLLLILMVHKIITTTIQCVIISMIQPVTNIV